MATMITNPDAELTAQVRAESSCYPGVAPAGAAVATPAGGATLFGTAAAPGVQDAAYRLPMGGSGLQHAVAAAAEAYCSRLLPVLNGDGPPAYRGRVVHTAAMSAACLRAGDGWRTVVTIFVAEERHRLVRHLRLTGFGAQLLFDAIVQSQGNEPRRATAPRADDD